MHWSVNDDTLCVTQIVFLSVSKHTHLPSIKSKSLFLFRHISSVTLNLHFIWNSSHHEKSISVKAVSGSDSYWWNTLLQFFLFLSKPTYSVIVIVIDETHYFNSLSAPAHILSDSDSYWRDASHHPGSARLHGRCCCCACVCLWCSDTPWTWSPAKQTQDVWRNREAGCCHS